LAASRTSPGAGRQPKRPCGEAADRAAFAKAADILLRDAKGFAHNAFKVGLARRTVERALTQAANGTPQSQSSKKIR
jgi:xanthine dehydrogenase YagS FAD-binding subunit